MGYQVKWNGKPEGPAFASYKDAHRFKGASMAVGIKQGKHSTLWRIDPTDVEGVALTPAMVAAVIAQARAQAPALAAAKTTAARRLAR